MHITKGAGTELHLITRRLSQTRKPALSLKRPDAAEGDPEIRENGSFGTIVVALPRTSL
jgi:hypothetical protein